MPRLQTFMAPFVDTFHGQAPTQHAHTYVVGLLSDVKRKNVESIAYHFGQDRLGLQGFIGWADWDDAPLRQELLEPSGQAIGTSKWRDGVRSLGVSQSPGASRWGWLGSGVVAWAKSTTVKWPSIWATCRAKGHTLVDMRLYLPKEWTQDKARLDKAGVPQDRRGYRTRHQLALEMLATTVPRCRIVDCG